MSTLSYGLNVTKKLPPLSSRPPPAKRKTIFDDDDDEGSNPEDDRSTSTTEAISTIGGLQPSSSTKPSTKPKASSAQSPPPTAQYDSLSTKHSTNKHSSTAQDLDPSIYDYDTIYDSLHSKKPNPISSDRKPRYMTALLAAAKVRERDQLRAKEKMLAKEREAEGEEFADKEKFVTGAYKKQQEVVLRLEEEELKREEEEKERRKRGGGGMVGLYKGLLDREEKRHEVLVQQVEKGKDHAADEEASEEKPPDITDAELAREKGALVNDEGAVVDKRQLLNAGLNVKPKPTAFQANQTQAAASARGPSAASGGLHVGDKKGMRERQSRMLEAQLEQAAKRAADDEEVQQMALERAAKSRKTEGEISSARERYLQRKREAANTAAAATAAGAARET